MFAVFGESVGIKIVHANMVLFLLESFTKITPFLKQLFNFGLLYEFLRVYQI